AIEEVPSHCRSRLQNASDADGLHDSSVLALERLAIGASRYSWPAANRLSRDNEASAMLPKPSKLRVPGRVGTTAMEHEIFGDRVLAALERGVDGRKALHDLADLRRRAAIGGQAGGLDLDAGAQFHHLQHGAQRRQRVDLDAQRPARVFRDKGADALAR